jgi:hypothetical protein
MNSEKGDEAAQDAHQLNTAWMVVVTECAVEYIILKSA